MMSIYNFAYTAMENRPVQMAEYKGKVLLIVNTASKCGFTPQYEGLEELYRAYGDRGFAVIGFPSNQFMEQEPGDNQEIAQFCKLRFGVTFPLSQKVDVRGENSIPLYRYLTEQKPFLGLGEGEGDSGFEKLLRKTYGEGYSDEQIKWNFTKFLVDREGNVVGRYEPPVEPKDLAPEIEKLLSGEG